MKYLITLHKSKYGYAVHVPALPGCHSQGATEREAVRNAKDAIMTYLEIEKEEIRASKVREIDVALA
jgi:predicted RNase H-like HicB family nuclease